MAGRKAVLQADVRSDLAFFLVGLLLLLLLPSRPAEAAATNCGNTGHYFDGAVIRSTNNIPDGVQSDIEIRFPDICQQSLFRFTSGWVMISNQNQGVSGWAQIGWIHATNLCCHRHFWQWTRDFPGNDVHTAYWGVPDAGTRRNFKVSRLTSDGHLHMTLFNPDDVPPCNQAGVCAETSFDPNTGTWPGAERAQVFNETNYPGSDVAGTPGNHATFINQLVKETGDPWLDPSGGTASADCTFYKFEHVSPFDYTHWRTYTEPISHSSVC